MRARGLLAIALSLGLLFPASLSAAPAESDAVDFVVTPSQLELRVAPGASTSASVRIYNKGDTPLALRTYVQDVEIPPSDLIGSGDIAFSASAWVRFRERRLRVPAEGYADVHLVARVPQNAAPGGYHAFGYVQNIVPPDTEGTGLVLSGRIGVTLLLEVVPPGFVLTRSARVSDMDVSVHWDGLFHPSVETATTVENTGDTYVLAGGMYTYRAWPGSGTSRPKVGPETLLRGTRHTFTSSWTGVPFLGRITVTSEIVYQRGPDDLPAIVMQRTVWIIPWPLIAVVAALMVLLLALRRVRRRGPAHGGRHVRRRGPRPSGMRAPRHALGFPRRPSPGRARPEHREPVLERRH